VQGALASLAAWRDAGKHFRYRDRPVFYRDDGAGTPLVLIHGFPTASWDWAAIWPALRERFRLVAPDMLGFGFSAKPLPWDYSILDQATLHEELLRALGAGSAHVLAHDYGDTVAQELLVRFAERRRSGTPGLELRSVCFLNGGLFPEVHRARPIQKLLASPLGPLLARLTNESAFHRGFSAVFGPDTRPDEETLHAWWTLVSSGGGVRVGPRLLGYIRERRRHRDRWVGVLERSPVPLRFVNGPEDPVSGRHMAERYRELVPAADLVLLPGIGHYPQMEDPEGVTRAFLSFIDGVEEGPEPQA